MMAQVNTALWPTVTVVTLTFWSSGRVSRYTSVGKKSYTMLDEEMRTERGIKLNCWQQFQFFVRL